MKIKNEILRGIGKYMIVIILIVSTIAFIDFRSAVFVGSICVSILVIRSMIGTLNPGHIIGYSILKNGKKLSVPPRVEVFDLVDATSPDKLYKYVNLFRSMVITPRILVIRFQESFDITDRSVVALDAIEKLFSEEKIVILFSEVDDNLKCQLIKMDLIKKVSDSNVFKNIDDALSYARKIL